MRSSNVALWLTVVVVIAAFGVLGSPPSLFAQGAPCADLIVTNLTPTPAMPVRDQNAVIGITVRNQGTCSTLGFVVQWKPTLFTPALSKQVSSLGPGASTTVSFNYIFPTAGNLITEAIVDSSRTVDETNEFNNDFPKLITVLKAGVDLVITGFTINPANPVQGRVAQATIMVQNLGNSPAGDFVVQWKPALLSSDLSSQVNGLGPGASRSVTFDYTYALFGEFTTLAAVDSTHKVTETDEFNNNTSMLVTVHPPRADLIITSLTIAPFTSARRSANGSA